MKVCIAMPAQDMVHTTFMMSVLNMCFYSRNQGIELSVTQMNGCYLDLLRNQLVQSALKTNPDFILILDSDMTFPPNTLERLMLADKEIIGCNYVRRRPPFDPIACTAENPNNRIDPNQFSGTTQASIIPTGVMMIKTSVFSKIAYPWFENIWRKSDNRLVGEDVVFCAKAGDLKIPVFCDHDLSREIAHSGQMDFTISMICEEVINNEKR